MTLRTSIITCSAILLATASLNALAQDTAASDMAVLRNTVVNLLEAMVRQGLISKESAEKLVADAQAKANAEVAVQAAGDAVGPGDVRVTYVPQVVQDQITAQVKQDVQASVVADVKKAAAEEGWGVPAALPSWVRNARWSGDIRVRGEHTGFADGNALKFDWQAVNEAGGIAAAGVDALLNTSEDQTRYQVKMSFGAQFDVAENALASIRFATGNEDNPVTRNQALGSYDRTSPLLLEEAYLSLGTSPERTNHQVLFWAGRTPNPYQSTELVWDNDVRFNGFTTQYSWGNPQSSGGPPLARGLFAAGGAYPVQEVELSSDDKWLLAGQVGYEVDIVPEFRVSAAVGYFDYQNITGKLNQPDSRLLDYTAPEFLQKGNTPFDIRNDADTTDTELAALAADFNLVDVSLLASWTLKPDLVLDMAANYVTNVGYDVDEVIQRAGCRSITDPVPGGPTEVCPISSANAYRLEFRFGNPDIARPGAWRAFLAYHYVEGDAVLDAFTDSDFHRGGTDAEGYIIGGEFGITNNTWARLRYLTADEIDGAPLGIDVLQLDLNAKF
ncbi:MAG: putative porin [Gammaproteobacteria bacterium]|nr:putative porin [Gammaproteobacteria bacterium]